MIVRLGFIFCPDCGEPIPVADFQPSEAVPELYAGECPVCGMRLQAKRNRRGELMAEPLREA